MFLLEAPGNHPRSLTGLCPYFLGVPVARPGPWPHDPQLPSQVLPQPSLALMLEARVQILHAEDQEMEKRLGI